MIRWGAVWQKTVRILNLQENVIADQYAKTDDELVKQAYEELKQAYNFFENADDVLLTEYAIYNVKAAEKRYEYLLKKLRNQQQAVHPCV